MIRNAYRKILGPDQDARVLIPGYGWLHSLRNSLRAHGRRFSEDLPSAIYHSLVTSLPFGYAIGYTIVRFL